MLNSFQPSSLLCISAPAITIPMRWSLTSARPDGSHRSGNASARSRSASADQNVSPHLCVYRQLRAREIVIPPTSHRICSTARWPPHQTTQPHTHLQHCWTLALSATLSWWWCILRHTLTFVTAGLLHPSPNSSCSSSGKQPAVAAGAGGISPFHLDQPQPALSVQPFPNVIPQPLAMARTHQRLYRLLHFLTRNRTLHQHTPKLLSHV